MKKRSPLTKWGMVGAITFIMLLIVLTLAQSIESRAREAKKMENESRERRNEIRELLEKAIKRSENRQSN